MTPHDLLEKYETALSKQQWYLVAPLMHKDICVTFSNGTFKGIDQVQTAFEANFALIKEEEYAISHTHWAHITETHAVCLYEFNWSGMISGALCSGSGRGTSVFIFEQGKWQIINEHLGPSADN